VCDQGSGSDIYKVVEASFEQTGNQASEWDRGFWPQKSETKRAAFDTDP
jgi:hypothetical protein